MLAGSRQVLGIEIERVQDVDGWALGRYLLWIGGAAVGDPADDSVHLNGCVGWLRDFVDNPRDRNDPKLFSMPADVVFSLVRGGILDDSAADTEARAAPLTAFARFDISYLGMSSFDRVTLLLIEDAQGTQRCIWQQDDGPLREAFLPPRHLQAVAAEALRLWETVPAP